MPSQTILHTENIYRIFQGYHAEYYSNTFKNLFRASDKQIKPLLSLSSSEIQSNVMFSDSFAYMIVAMVVIRLHNMFLTVSDVRFISCFQFQSRVPILSKANLFYIS